MPDVLDLPLAPAGLGGAAVLVVLVPSTAPGGAATPYQITLSGLAAAIAALNGTVPVGQITMPDGSGLQLPDNSILTNQ